MPARLRRRLVGAILGLFGLLAVLAACGGPGPAPSLEGGADPLGEGGRGLPKALAQGSQVQVTVYNGGFALVKDRRTFSLEAGVQEVPFRDVSAQIDPTSVQLTPVEPPEGVRILEQTYRYDLIRREALLRRYLGARIQVLTQDGEELSGVLVGTSDGLILAERPDGGKVQVVPLERIARLSFPELPEGLLTRPTLVWLLEAEQAGPHTLELAYLTEGLTWSADYVLRLAPEGERARLTGWVTVRNETGTTFPEARLKLVAGDVNRVRPPEALYGDGALRGVPETAKAAPQFEERALFEYHLYELQRPTTLENRSSKQIEFIAAPDVPVEKVFVYDGLQLGRFRPYSPILDPAYGARTGNTKVWVMLQLRNDEASGLGKPLPAGRIRVYQEDADGGAEFVGEDRIDHTPRDETVRLYLGNAFDLVGERTQTDFRRLGESTIEESYRIVLRNHKDEAVEVRVVEHLFRWSQWEIRESSHDYEKLDSNTVEFRVEVPADGEVEVTYTVRYFW